MKLFTKPTFILIPLGSDSESVSAYEIKQSKGKAIVNENTDSTKEKIETISGPSEVDHTELPQEGLKENGETAPNGTACDEKSNEEELSSEIKSDIEKKNE